MSEEKKLVPKLRFEEFGKDEKWKEYLLEELIEVNNGKDYKHLEKGNIPVYGTGGYMTSVNAALSYEKDAIGIGRKGTINRPYIIKAPFWTVDTLFYAIPKFDSSISFFHGVFKNINWLAKQESTGVPSLSKATINSIKISIPTIQEQEKIGGFLKTLDEMIQLQQSKVNKIKDIKAAYLSEMFPKEGEKYPKRRFEGFTEPWKNYMLSDIAKIIGGGTPDTTNSAYWNGTINWYSPTEIGKTVYVSESARKITTLGYQNSSANLLPPNKTILFTSRAGIGSMAILKKAATTNQGFQSLVLNDNINTYFLYSMGHLIKKYAEHNASGSTFMEISGESLGKMLIKIPSMEEQQKIGEFFKNIDTQIATEEEKLAKLEKLKQAYLNDMFV